MRGSCFSAAHCVANLRLPPLSSISTCLTLVHSPTTTAMANLPGFLTQKEEHWRKRRNPQESNSWLFLRSAVVSIPCSSRTGTLHPLSFFLSTKYSSNNHGSLRICAPSRYTDQYCRVHSNRIFCRMISLSLSWKRYVSERHISGPTTAFPPSRNFEHFKLRKAHDLVPFHHW